MLKSSQTICDEQKNFVTICKDISRKTQTLLHQAHADFQEGTDIFLSEKIGKLFQIVGIYREAFEKVSVETKSEFDRLAKRYFSCPEVREAFDDVTQSEKEWDDFVEDVDKTLHESAVPPLKEGDFFPVESVFINARSKENDEFKHAGAEILIVSFGEGFGATKWLEETGFRFHMILDSERKIYHTFGLYRSVSKVWSSACMMYYTEQLLKGRQLPRPLENVHDDPQQMGGDFILDSTGRVVFSYCSQVSSDRPSIDHILAALIRQNPQGKVSQEN